MTAEYILLGILAVISAHQILALATVQRQVSENNRKYEQELQSLRNKLSNHIHSESDDGK